MNDELLNTKQAAFYCGVSLSNLANKRIYGGGPYFIKIGAKVSYRKSDLDAWLLANRFPDRKSIPEDHESRQSERSLGSDGKATV